MSSHSVQQVPVTWEARDVLAVVAFMVGPFVAPVVAPVLGVLLVRASSRWSPSSKRVATVLGLLPVSLAVFLVLISVLGLAREPSHLLLGLVVVAVSTVSSVIAGALLLAGYRRAALPRG